VGRIVGGIVAVTTLLFFLAVAGPVPDAGLDSGPAVDAGVVDADSADVPVRDPAPDAPSDGAGNRTMVGRLHGRVLAKGSRGPVSAAKVVALRTDGLEPMGEAGDDGSFDLAIPCGPSGVTVRAPGFDPLVFDYDACVTSEPLIVRLVPRPDLPVYETVVVAPRDEPGVVLLGPELVTTPGSLGDPFRVIESLPGVATVAWPAPIYAIRGSNPGNTGYFLDDVQVPLLFHLALGPSVIHPAFFDSMTFYPGGYPPRFGRYAAGIVASQTRAPAEDRVHATAEVRLYDAGGMASSPWPDGNGGVAAAFRYSYTGALLSLLRNDLRLAYWDYQLRADRRVRGWALSLLLFGSGDDLAYRLNPGDPEREYLLRFHRASLRASRSIGEGRLSASVALGADHSTAPIVQNFPITADATSIIPRASYLRETARIDYEAGIDGQAQWLRPMAGVVEAGASDLARSRTALLLAGYASASIRATDRLSLTPGLRLDTYTIGGVTKSDLGPRLAARLALDDKTWLSGSGGRFSQAPSLTVQIPAAENFGLALYGLQTAWQGSLGFATRHVPGVEVEVTGYLQRYVLTDLRDPALINPDPLARDFLVRRDARSYGLELMIRRPVSERLHGWISYTLSQSQRALGGVVGPSDWDQRHILNAVLGYRLGRYELGARGHLNTGRPVLVNGGESETFVRLPTFYQLDLRAERRLLFEAFTLNVYVELVNATLSREVYELDQHPTGEPSQRSLRIVLPAIGIRGEL
jgi:hypothetical protein